MNDHTNKGADVWVLRTNLLALFRDDYDPCIYQKDATSSGLQLIGLLMNNNHLCQISNVVGGAYCDIYQIEAEELQRKITKCKEFIEGTFKDLIIKYSRDNPVGDYFFQLLASDPFWEKEKESRLRITENIALLEKNNPGYKGLKKQLEALPVPNVNFDEEEDEDKKNIDPLRLPLAKIRGRLKLTKIIENNPDLSPVVATRKAIKQVIMVLGYQAGKDARLTHLYDYYKEQLILKSYGSINHEELLLLSKLINTFNGTSYSRQILLLEIFWQIM